MKQNEIINAIRCFNRYYIRTIGLLQSTILNSGYSLTEAHVLNVVHDKVNSTATAINKILNIDEGYLSRVIKKMISKELISKERTLEDKRIFAINITEKGKIAYEKLDLLSSNSVDANINYLCQKEKEELVDLMTRAMYLMKKNDDQCF